MTGMSLHSQIGKVGWGGMRCRGDESCSAELADLGTVAHGAVIDAVVQNRAGHIMTGLALRMIDICAEWAIYLLLCMNPWSDSG